MNNYPPVNRPVRKHVSPKPRLWTWGHTDYRLPKLNPPPIQRITGATDIHAIGFLNYEMLENQRLIEESKKK